MSRIGAVILAAGESARLGRPKQLLEIDGEPLLRRVAMAAVAAGCSPIVIVLGAVVGPCRDSLVGLETILLVNDQWREGIASSIVAGVTTAEKLEVDAVLLLVCDQPLVTTSSLERLIAAYAGRGMVVACYDGTLGTPAIFSAEYFFALRQLSGDRGAKALIQRHAAEMVAVDVPEAATDIDSASDWDGLVHA